MTATGNKFKHTWGDGANREAPPRGCESNESIEDQMLRNYERSLTRRQRFSSGYIDVSQSANTLTRISKFNRTWGGGIKSVSDNSYELRGHMQSVNVKSSISFDEIWRNLLCATEKLLQLVAV